MIREQLLNPSAAELTAFLLKHTRAKQCLIQVAGEAEVSYQGRAASMAVSFAVPARKAGHAW